jgi:hypothetical protein
MISSGQATQSPIKSMFSSVEKFWKRWMQNWTKWI